MNNIRSFFMKLQAWFRSRKVRRALRAAGTVADTTAAGVGAVIQLVLRAVATVLLVLLVTGLLFTCIFAVYVKTCLSDGLDISLEEVSLSLSSTIWYQENDESWHELAKLYSTENRTWVDYENIPVYMQQAAVAIEDKRFYEHKGVDWYRTVAAFMNMFLSMSNTFGGSTITQQLIKNVTKEDDVTVQRKLMEIFRALEFEKKYTKEEIITWYLNDIYLGEGCYGVNSAANTYFGKDVWELSLAECACIIGITNNPSAYDPYIYPENNQKRQQIILREMYEQGYIDYEEYDAARNEELVFAHDEEDEDTNAVYSWYVETIIEDAVRDLAEERGIASSAAERLIHSGGYNIYACIDMDIQRIVDDYYQNTYNLPGAYRRSSQQLQSAIVIIEPRTGDIVALEGGVGEKKQNLLWNLATMAKRPPGSSFKPLAVYSPALDVGLINQTTVFNDAAGLSLSGTNWYPRNSGGYSGYIPVSEALRLSKNTVAAQILDRLGLATSWEYLTKHYGITSLVEAGVDAYGNEYTDYAYAPLSLGQLSEGITVREMAQAYTAFVNDGYMSYGRTYSMITDQDGNVVLDNSTEQIHSIKANTAANMCAMLKNAVASGTGTEAYFSGTAIGGKTGTTSDDKDRYFVGFTMYYVAAVWTGYQEPERMYFSGNPACQIWRSIMSQIHSGLSYWSFPTGYINSASLISAAEPSPTEEECPPHDYLETITVEATCTEAGEKTLMCSRCSDTQTEVIPPLGHDYQITSGGTATCTAGGTATYTCTRCGDSYTETVSALGHDFQVVSSTAATCTAGGSTTYRCTRCGESKTETTSALGHSYSSTVTTSPGCTTEGVRTNTCSVCGDTYTETIPATGHSYSSSDTTSPTCTTEGVRTYTCSVCGDSYTEAIPATGHSDASGDGLCDVCGAPMA